MEADVVERLTNTINGKVIPQKQSVPCSDYCTSCGKADCAFIRRCLRRLAAYEDVIQTPEEAFDMMCEWVAMKQAKKEGRLIVLDNQLALAIAAGMRAIGTNRRCEGATYVFDPFGEEGGPYGISYATAQKILAEIWYTCPLDPTEGKEKAASAATETARK